MKKIMRPKAFIAFAVLIPAICLLSSCRSNTKPAGAETKSTTETVATDDANAENAESESDSKGKGPIEVRSGIIEYAYSGDKTGKSIQYFDDYGMKNAVYAEIVSRGESSKGWTVTIGDDQYMWDPSKSTQGMKTKNPMIKMMMEASGKEMESYMAKMYEQIGMTKSGTEIFQGKECTVFKGDMGKVLIWKGILMKMEINVGTTVSRQEVTSIKTNIQVDNKYFRIPDNITFSEIPGFN
jgi:hypothetical protein